MSIPPTIAIAGAGAAGVFAAIAAAEAAPRASILVFEKSPQPLTKVRISGGGRCNVTHACFDPKELAGFYPRGGNALIGPFHRFQPRDTQAWFEARGVRLAVEPDGRMFPGTHSSQTIVDCLLRAARESGVRIVPGAGVESAMRQGDSSFLLGLSNGEEFRCHRLMLATGGCRTATQGRLATSLGHSLLSPVPSLFSFLLDAPWLVRLAGVSLPRVQVGLPANSIKHQGGLLITHEGISGPAVLRLSAWAARQLHDCGYRFTVRVNWLPDISQDRFASALGRAAQASPARRVVNSPLFDLPSRLWEILVRRAGIQPETRWTEFSAPSRHKLTQLLFNCDLLATGKSLNKEEFVTCGGVPLKEVDFKTMQSRLCPGLYFGGELLDIDGLTGGFNFQAAWTTGWIAGKSMGEKELPFATAGQLVA